MLSYTELIDLGRYGFSDGSSADIRLSASDADLVDVIHTSRVGYLTNVGHVDFFPNGGRNQVWESGTRDGDRISHCERLTGDGWEHQRAVQYYEESIGRKTRIIH